MTNTRYEKYKTPLNGFPFCMNIDLKRTPKICSTEPNRHENLEFQLCTSGEGNVLLNGKKYVFGKGDLVVVNSNVIHYTFSETELTYSCLIISTEWCKQMNIDYDKIDFLPVIKNHNIELMFLELEKLYSDNDNPLNVAKANMVLLQLMIAVVESFSETRNHTLPRKNTECIELAVSFMHSNFSRKITLDEIASAVFLNKYTLCKEFKYYTGQTVFENLNRFRIQKAAEHLENGHSVSETAFLCGFSNHSFFTKTFKQYLGTTPLSYKKSRISSVPK